MKKESKNSKKVIKKSAKSSLESPLIFHWPSIKLKLYSDVVQCLKDTFSNICTDALNNSSIKLLSTSNGNEQFSVINSAIKESGIIFGYNAVMRGLEKNKIQCVLVNAETKPDYLLKTFIPHCSLKFIPLIPIKTLSEIVEEHVKIKSAIAVGFVTDACRENGKFNELYSKCCKALGFTEIPFPLKVAQTPNSSSKFYEEKKSTCLNPIKIDDIHLKRQTKSERIFRPLKRNLHKFSNILNTDDSFIVINDENNLENSVDTIKFRKNIKSSPHTTSNVSDVSFFIDTGEMSVDVPESSELPGSKNSQEKSLDCKKRKSESNVEYIPAKIKKTKGNADRKKNKGNVNKKKAKGNVIRK